MNYTYEMKGELRNFLRGRKIREIEFGSGGSVGLADEREIALHLDNGETLLITASTYQTLTFEAS